MIILEVDDLAILELDAGLEEVGLEVSALPTLELSDGLEEIDLYESPLRMVANG
jgi:hypothetical protein